MPLYTYLNPENGETKDVFQTMKEEHVYFEKGVEWLRVFSSPQLGIDSRVDTSTIEGWRKHTQKKGTVGDLLDASAEASEKRKDKLGIDPVKERYYERYSSLRNGRKHPDVIKRESKKSLDKIGIEIV